MRFRRCPLPTYAQSLARDANPSTRRIAAAGRAVARQRASCGLFADQVEIETPEERLARFAIGNAIWSQRFRDREAREWRRARACIFAQPEPLRSDLLRAWREAPYPGSPAYLLDWLYQQNLLPREDTGELRDAFEARMRAEGRWVGIGGTP